MQKKYKGHAMGFDFTPLILPLHQSLAQHQSLLAQEHTQEHTL
jgi:hypothetical protein